MPAGPDAQHTLDPPPMSVVIVTVYLCPLVSGRVCVKYSTNECMSRLTFASCCFVWLMCQRKGVLQVS